MLRPGGLWLNASFRQTGEWWQSVLLKTMFIFFRLICRIEASNLPGISSSFNRNGYRLSAEKAFFRDFIAASVYIK